MSELSPETQELLAAGGDVVPMDPLRRARVKRAVLMGAAAGVTVGMSSMAAASASSLFSGTAKVFVLGAVVGGLGGAAGVAWQRLHSDATRTHAVTTAPSSVRAARAAQPRTPPTETSAPLGATLGEVFIAPGQVEALKSQERTLAAPSPKAEPSPIRATPLPARARFQDAEATTAAPVRDAATPIDGVQRSAPSSAAQASLLLAEEARLLREAVDALRQRAPDHSLRLLDEHAARFPRGVLEPERSAQRVFALCQAGRTSDARAAAARFLSVSRPLSLAAKVRSSCALQNE